MLVIRRNMKVASTHFFMVMIFIYIRLYFRTKTSKRRKTPKMLACDHIPLAFWLVCLHFFFFCRLSPCIIVILCAISFTGFSNENFQ